jgi:hypothetical protein
MMLLFSFYVLAMLLSSINSLKLVNFIARKSGSKRMTELNASSFYDITEIDAKGNPVSFSKFKGKVVYGVNVASKCGYTSSGYNLLSRIAALKDKGVEVALFPCNQVIFIFFNEKSLYFFIKFFFSY